MLNISVLLEAVMVALLIFFGVMLGSEIITAQNKYIELCKMNTPDNPNCTRAYQSNGGVANDWR